MIHCAYFAMVQRLLVGHILYIHDRAATFAVAYGGSFYHQSWIHITVPFSSAGDVPPCAQSVRALLWTSVLILYLLSASHINTSRR